MKKIIAAVAAILALANIGVVKTAKVVAVEYHETGDYRTAIFETTDGNLWAVDDYTAPIGSDCLLIMDDNGTEQVEDDSIEMVISFNLTGKNEK